MAKDNYPPQATRHDRTEHVPREYRRLDALARLLEYRGVCAAVAVDPDTKEIVVAHNKPSTETFNLVTKFTEIFANIARNPQAEQPVDRLLDLVAESASGISSNSKMISLIGRKELYEILVTPQDRLTNPNLLIDSFNTLYKGELYKQVETLISQIKEVKNKHERNLAILEKENERDYERWKPLPGNKHELEPKIKKRESEIYNEKKSFEVFDNATRQLTDLSITIPHTPKQGLKKLLGDIVAAAQPYFAMQYKRLDAQVQKDIDVLANPDLPNKSYDISRLMIDIDKIVKDLRSHTGLIYNAIHQLKTPVIVLQHTVAPETGMHAEMKIARYFINKLALPDDSPPSIKKLYGRLPYIGISKLCCYDCNNVLHALRIGTRGAHAVRSVEWIRPKFLTKMPRMQSLINLMEKHNKPSEAKSDRLFADSSPFKEVAGVKVSPLRESDRLTSGADVNERRNAVRKSLFSPRGR